MAYPRVTVLLPVYNGERFIEEAVASVLAQSFRDFELIVIDDGSTDKTTEILYAIKERTQDPRIHILQNKENLKLIRSLNEGIRVARGKYIARMDADDICFSDRLERQVRFLDDNPSTAVVGGDIVIFRSDVRDGVRPIPPALSHAQIRWELMRSSGLSHPTVMIRRSIFESEKPYDPQYVHCEDYELWLRVSHRHKLANLREPVLYYRHHGQSISNLNSRTQRLNAEKALALEIEYRIGIKPTDVTTGLLMEPKRIGTYENIDEYVDLYPMLLDEMLKQVGLTKQDRTQIQTRALVETVRLLIRAIFKKTKFVPILTKLLFRIEFDYRAIIMAPVFVAQVIARRLRITKVLQPPSASV